MLDIDKAISNIKKLTLILEAEAPMLGSYNLAKYIDNFEEKMLLLDEVIKLQTLLKSNKSFFENMDKDKLNELKAITAKFEEIKNSNSKKVNNMAESNKLVVDAIKKAAIQTIRDKSGYNVRAKQVNRLFLEKEMSAFTYNNKV